MRSQRHRPRPPLPSAAETDHFERLFRDHYDAVLAYALARANIELAKDAAAQTFLVAWRRREELPQSPRGWLLGVARRSLADLRRARDRQIALGVRVCLLDGAHSAAADTAEMVTQKARRSSSAGTVVTGGCRTLEADLVGRPQPSRSGGEPRLHHGDVRGATSPGAEPLRTDL
jgi:DNA-directed RNA polymerase specialized sigma24 family protein